MDIIDKAIMHLLFVLILNPLLAISCTKAEEELIAFSPIISPKPGELDVQSFLLPGEEILQQEVADIDNDGDEEIIISSSLGLVVLSWNGYNYVESWRAEVAVGKKVSELNIRDINGDGILEVLLFEASPDGREHALYIYAWRDTTYVLLNPKGGVLEGHEAFDSAYYPPIIRDLDGNGIEEIIVFVERPQVKYLNCPVYEWDGQVYRYNDFFFVMPRFRPKSESE